LKQRGSERGKTRFTMWLERETLATLERLQNQTGKGSVADVIREAVAVYASLMTASKRGLRFGYENRKTGEKGKIWLLPGPPPIDEA
jgi:hypothetical protein